MLNRLLKSIRRDRPAHAVTPTIDDVLKRSLTYLDVPALNDLHVECQRIEKEGIEGLFIEAGCALGGSSIVIASAKALIRPLSIFDVFDTIPPPSELDGRDVHARYASIQRGEAEGLGGNRYYGYEDNLMDKVRDNFRACGVDPGFARVSFVKGLFQDTMDFHEPIAFAHIDGDWYESVTTCLERIVPHLQVGGTLVVDDYHHWSGCRRAVDDFFSQRKRGYRFINRARLHIRKT